MKQPFNGLFSIKTLKNKNLSVGIATAFLCFSLQLSAQTFDTTRKLQPVGGDGFMWKSGEFSGKMKAPNGLPTLSLKDSGSIAYANSGMNVWNGTTWVKIGSGAGGKTTATGAPDSTYFRLVNTEGRNYRIQAVGVVSSGQIAANTYLQPSDTLNRYPRLIAGTNISVTGTYPNLTINSSGGGAAFDSTTIYRNLGRKIDSNVATATFQPIGNYLRPTDTTNKFIRLIAGSNITLSGTAPNITVSAASGGTTFDSTTIYNQVNARVRYSDTASQLNAYKNAISTNTANIANNLAKDISDSSILRNLINARVTGITANLPLLTTGTTALVISLDTTTLTSVQTRFREDSARSNIYSTIAGKENGLGNPSTNGYVLSSSSTGVRSWIAPASGGGGSTFTNVSADTINIRISAKDSSQFSVFQGTSITKGSSSTLTLRGYSTIVAPGLNTSELNYGVSGATLSSFISSNLSFIPNYNSSYKYQFFEFGTNEVLNSIDTNTYKTNYKRVLDTSLARGWNKSNQYFMSNVYIDTINNSSMTIALQLNMFNACKNFCIANGLNFIDIFSVGYNNANNNYYNVINDNTKIHPGDEGHSIIGRRIIANVNALVVKNTQTLAVNGTAEIQNLKLSLADDYSDSSSLPLAFDYKKRKIVVMPYGNNIKSTGYLNPQNANINLNGDIINNGNILIKGNINLANKGKAKALHLWYDSTGNVGHLFAYNGLSATSGNVIVDNGKLGVNISNFGSSPASILTSGVVQTASTTVTGSIGYLTGTTAGYASITSGNYYFFGQNSSGSRIPITLEPYVLVNGTTNVSNQNLQVTGNAFISTKLAIGSTVASTASLTITPQTTGGQNGTVGMNISSPGVTISENTVSPGTTIAHVAINSLGVNTITSSNSQTYTSASTLYVAGAPIGAGSVTISNPYSIYAANGMTYLGGKLNIATGSNASIGSATLVGGTVTVATTAVTTNSKIFVTVTTPSGTQGFLSTPTITNATSFVINSTSATETSVVNWWIIN